eukprot:103085-Pleurochrysis_carterae.AAC.1
MLAIFGSHDYTLFIDAAVTERFSQTGSLRTTSRRRPTLASRPAESCATQSSLASALRASWRR